MSSKSRLALPLAAALVLGAVLAMRLFWPAPEAARTPAGAPSAASVPTQGAPPEPSPLPTPARVRAPAEAEEGARASVVSVGPGEEMPEPEVEDALPRENDPLEPELPQTPEWRHEKLVRMTELLGRDVERLEEERQAAKERGDGAEARRLAVQLARHRARLGKLREETAALAESAGLARAE